MQKKHDSKGIFSFVLSAADGLAQIGNAFFMIRNPKTAKTHAINPKTRQPYCGWKIKWTNWEPTDKLPDDKNQPSCIVCQRHYDDPIKEELFQIKKELEETISEFLFMQIHTKNSDGGLGRFVETIAKFIRSEKVKAEIRQKLNEKIKEE